MTEPSTAPWPSLGGAPTHVLAGGLINATWVVGDPPRAVVQRINPIFGSEVHEDIEDETLASEFANFVLAGTIERSR